MKRYNFNIKRIDKHLFRILSHYVNVRLIMGKGIFHKRL